MSDMNYDRLLRFFLQLNLKIEKGFFKQTVFLDEKVEREYKMERNTSSTNKKFHLDAFIIFSYIAIIAYIYIHDYGDMFVYILLCCLGLSLILIATTYFESNPNFDLLINHVLVFQLSLFLNWKIIYIACFLNTPDNDNDTEIIRTIIYDFVGSNILAFLALDTRLSVSTSLFLLNFSATIVAQYKSNANHYYFVDGLCNLPVTIFFYLFKKIWEETDRDSFADKYRFAKYYNYTKDFIKGQNGYYLNISKDFSISCDAKMKTLLNNMHIYRNPGNSNNFDQILEISEVNRNNEINCLISINASVSEENYGNFSAEILNLFKLYEEEDWANGNRNSSKEILPKKLKVLMLEHPTTNFNKVGIFKLPSFICTKYFEVHFRKFDLGENDSVNDILMYDVTELITSNQKIFEEGIIKEKIIAKIIHEFKTPINSVIAIVGCIVDSIDSPSLQDKTMLYLETIRNLSTYEIFLINDIIHLTQIKSLEQIKLVPHEINLREIVYFCYDILMSLLSCSKSKSEAIQPLLEFDDDIDSLHIKAHEIKLKQIILNILSNSVKFTKCGMIAIKCSVDTLKEIVVVSISDTGIGIRDNEQGKLLNDFQIINNDTVNNSMCGGLGLSICKSLASSMDIQISISSIYGVGSDFSLEIPYKPESLINNSGMNILEHVIDVNRCKTDQESEIKFQELRINNSGILPTELSHQLGFDLKNKNRMNESKNQTSSIISKHSSKTVKLGIKESTIPKLNNLDVRLDHDVRCPRRTNESRVISESCRIIEIMERKKQKILIADENYYNGEATKNMLDKILKEYANEFEIIICFDGVEIIYQLIQDQSRGNQIKSIITDQNMQYINGSDAIRIIRNLERRQKIEFVNIISLTGNDESHYTSEILNAGAQIVLSKPLQKIAMVRALKQLNII